MYYAALGIGTYDFILEERERDELKVKLEQGTITEDIYKQLLQKIVDDR